jgi:hypothetical protein
MGKKKASRSKVMRPILEEAIREGLVFCRHRPRKSLSTDMDSGVIYEFDLLPSDPGLGYELYEVTFGNDTHWWVVYPHSTPTSSIPIEVRVYEDGRIDYQFVFDRAHVLSREHEVWFKQELEEIITMHKLGGYSSELPPASTSGLTETASYIRNATKAGLKPYRTRVTNLK